MGRRKPADEDEIGKPILDGDGKPLWRCTRCGIPRGTLRHALRCTAALCDDPDAALHRELGRLRAAMARVEALPGHPNSMPMNHESDRIIFRSELDAALGQESEKAE